MINFIRTKKTNKIKTNGIEWESFNLERKRDVSMSNPSLWVVMVCLVILGAMLKNCG